MQVKPRVPRNAKKARKSVAVIIVEEKLKVLEEDVKSIKKIGLTVAGFVLTKLILVLGLLITPYFSKGH